MSLLKQYLTFFTDDTHTIDGVVIAAGAVPTVAQTSCSTDPAHARPAMMVVLEGVDISVDLIEASIAIGSLQVEVQDNRRLGGQETGWLTYILADAQGHSNLIGQRLSFKQIDQFGAEYNVDLLIVDIALNKQKTSYKLTTRDMRERERTMRLFYRAEESVVWPPPLLDAANTGIRDGYGRKNPGDPTSPALLPASRGARATFKYVNWDAAIPLGQMVLEGPVWVDLDPAGPLDWHNLLGKYNLEGGSGGYDDSFTPTAQGSRLLKARVTGMTIQWRPWGSTGAWTELRNFPVWETHFNATSSIAPVSYGFFYAKTKSGPGRGVQALLGGLYASWFDFTKLPTEGQDIAIRVLSGLPPSEEAPIYYEGTFGTFLKRCYDGFYSLQAPGIRYNAAVMADLEVNTPIMRLVQTKIEPEGLRWLQEHWYKPMRMIPLINAAGELVPTKFDLPDASVSLVTLDNANVEDAEWKHGSGDAVTGVEFTYKRDYLGTNNRLSSIDVHVDRLDAPGVTRVGDRTIKFDPATVREVTANVTDSYGQAGGKEAEYGYYLAQQIQTALLDRFALGGQHCMATALRSDPNVRGLIGGQWVIMAVSWLPDYVSKLRGINRLMQIVDVKDTDPTLRHLELVDAGPYNTPTPVPSLADITASLINTRIKVLVGNVPADTFVRVDVATSPTQPGATSPLWMMLGRERGAGTKIIYSGKLSAGVTYIRVRHEQEGRRPSAWVLYGSTLTVPSELLTDMKADIQADGAVVLTWTPDVAVGGLRLYYQMVDPVTGTPSTLTTFVDVNGALGTYTLPGKLKQYHRMIVDAITYPGFAAGAVTGAAGITRRLQEAVRQEDQILLPEMQEANSETALTGFLELTPYDPSSLIHSVELQAYSGLVQAYNWTVVAPDGAGKYLGSVPLVERQVSIISYRIRIWQQNGTLAYMKAKPIRYAIGGVPIGPEVNPWTAPDGTFTVIVNGDSSTTHNRILITTDAPGSLDALDASTLISQRSGQYTHPTKLTLGQKYYITVASYNSGLGGTARSQSSPIVSWSEQWLGTSTSGATVMVTSTSPGPQSVLLNDVVLGALTSSVAIYVREFKADPGGAQDVSKTGYLLKTITADDDIEVPISSPLNYVQVTLVSQDALNRVGSSVQNVVNQAASIVNLQVRAAAATVIPPNAPTALSGVVTLDAVDLSVALPSTELPTTLRVKRDGVTLYDVAVVVGAGGVQHITDGGNTPGGHQYQVFGVRAGVLSSTGSPLLNVTIVAPTLVAPASITTGGWQASRHGFDVTITPGSGNPAGVGYVVEHQYTLPDNSLSGWSAISEGVQTSTTFIHVHEPLDCTNGSNLGTHRFRAKTRKAGYTDSSLTTQTSTDNVPCLYLFP